MVLQKIVIPALLFALYGCGDHSTGYKDGYGNMDKNLWLVFGRDEYLGGYHSGQAEKFQEDRV